MRALTFRIPWLAERERGSGPAPTSEWLVTNSLGGYASMTVTGHATRRHHGLLVAALGAPTGRYVMLNQLGESVRLPGGGTVAFGMGEQPSEKPRGRHDETAGMTEFRLDLGLPSWRFEFQDAVLEKDVVMPGRSNTVLIRYRLREAEGPVRLDLRPLVHFRRHVNRVGDRRDVGPYRLTGHGGHYELHGNGSAPPLRLALAGEGSEFHPRGTESVIRYPLERSRGYPDRGKLWSPGRFTVELEPGSVATLIASAEEWASLRGLRPERAFEEERRRRREVLALADRRTHRPEAAQLVLAADQFLVTPVTENGATIIAGYHWFTDWGRDTMISLEGVALLTGRHREAREILRNFGGAIRAGLVPNRFEEGRGGAVYYTADASLWFFHAIDRYREITGDAALVEELLPKLRDVVRNYRNGTRFGIAIDPADGLLRQGDPRYPLTWMDARCGDWVVTPRRGKAVEVNALWYNALRLYEGWLRDAGDGRAAGEAAGDAERLRRSFNDRFWNAGEGYLYDVVDGEDGDDPQCRPNQVFALSLHHPVLDPGRWHAVLAAVRQRLLTPVGLRTLAPGSPDYRAVYFGDRRARDAAYHQGTVWPWLIGPYVDAWLRVRPDDRRVAHEFLGRVLCELGTCGVGTLGEIHDAEEPYTARGCIAQAWSVAEVLRAYVRTAG